MHRRKVFYKKICFYDLWIFILLGLQNLLIYFEPIMVKQFIDKLFNLPNIKLSDYLFLRTRSKYSKVFNDAHKKPVLLRLDRF